MVCFVLRVEGVNFSNALEDTQDLSCVRGGGLALLHAAERVWALIENEPNATPIFSGASQCAFSFSSTDGEAVATRVRDVLACEGEDPVALEKTVREHRSDPDFARRQGGLPLAHLSFVVDIAQADDDSDAALSVALAKAEARNRARQLQSLTVRPPAYPHDAKTPCPLNHVLPADATIRLPKDRLPENEKPIDATPRADATNDEGQDDPRYTEVRASRSVAARRHYGRWMRQAFYRSELNSDPALTTGLRFTNSVLDICADAPEAVPESVRNKIAVIYADGNRFGKIQSGLGGGATLLPSMRRRFSGTLQGYRRDGLLWPVVGALLGMMSSSNEEVRKRAAVRLRDGDLALRFETLLWGGDEVTWIAPAWLGFWLAGGIFELSKDWAIDGMPLTHGVGMVICDRKAPLRSAQRVAKQLADIAKSVNDRVDNQRDLKSAICAEVFESVDLPEHGLDSHHHALFPGLGDRPEGTAALAMTSEVFGHAVQQIATLKAGEGRFPRSQIYKLLREAVSARAFAGGDGDQLVEAKLKAYLQNAGTELSKDAKDFHLWPDGDRPMALSLALASQFWDFIDVFGTPLPSLSTGGQAQ